MKLIRAAGFENVPMASWLRSVRWSFSLELADCLFGQRSSFQWQHSLHGIFEEVYMQAISSAMFQCQSSLNGYASPLNPSHRSTRPKHLSSSKARRSQAEANESTFVFASISLSKNTGDDRGRRERSSIVKTAGSATPVDREVLRFPLNVREVLVYRSDNQFSNMSFSLSIAPMKLMRPLVFENVPMASWLRGV